MHRLGRELESSRSRVVSDQRHRRSMLMREGVGRTLLVLVVLSFSIVFIWMTAPIARQWALESRSERFLKASGTLLSITVEEVDNVDWDARQIVPEYEYTVAGVTYSNGVMRPFPNSLSPRAARLEAERLRVMATVSVFYNPADPQESVLFNEPGEEAGMSKLMLVVAWLVLAIASVSAAWLMIVALHSLVGRGQDMG